MSGFGRKGLDGLPAQPTGHGAQSGFEGLRNSARGSFHAQPASPAISSRVDAFLASERQRARETHRGESEAGVSDYAAGYHGTAAKPERSLLVAYALWFILGQASAHRFYLGAYRSAFAQVGLFVFWLAVAFGTPKGAQNTVGPVLAIAVIGWILWVLGDVFFIHRIHRKLCRKPGEAAAAFA